MTRPALPVAEWDDDSDDLPQRTPPKADRIRLGDVWLDQQGRRHRADPCVAGLLLMVPLDHQLVPVAMDPTRPHPWSRIEWGGHLESPLARCAPGLECSGSAGADAAGDGAQP